MNIQYQNWRKKAFEIRMTEFEKKKIPQCIDFKSPPPRPLIFKKLNGKKRGEGGLTAIKFSYWDFPYNWKKNWTKKGSYREGALIAIHWGISAVYLKETYLYSRYSILKFAKPCQLSKKIKYIHLSKFSHQLLGLCLFTDIFWYWERNSSREEIWILCKTTNASQRKSDTSRYAWWHCCCIFES